MNSNTSLTKTVKQLKEVPGVLACVLEHEVSKTKASITWDGPKLNTIWPEILAFFKWTYDEHRSESQVRLYVNHQTKVWAAWAFPQEAKTGMSAREIDNEEARTQRMAFSDSEGWLYFGTVHHHCSAPAFQSGTDESNEKNQDGLHITVGKMDEKKHDLHCRLYVSGHKFEPNMSWFWDVAPLVATIPEGMRKFMADGIENQLARDQMCEPVPKDAPFPQQWRDNVIDIRPVSIATTTYQGGLGVGTIVAGNYSKSYKKPHNLPRDLWIASGELQDYWDQQHYKGNLIDFMKTLCSLSDESLLIIELTEILYRNDVGLEHLLEKLEELQDREIQKELKKEQKGNGKVKGKLKDKDAREEEQKYNNGIPDYAGPGDWSGYGG